MLGNKSFYNATIKRYVVAFAKIFGDVNVFRFENQDMLVHSEHNVPILYRNKNKMYQIKQMSQYAAGVSNVFPRMAFRLTNMTFDKERRLNKYNKIIKVGNAGDLRRIYTPKPYNFKFTLSLFTRNMDDTLMIVEQITSFFNPEYIVPIIEIPEIGDVQDIKFVIDDDINLDETDEENILEIDDDVIQTDIGFTCYGNVYPPVKADPAIKKIILEFGTYDTATVLDTDIAIFEEIIIDLTAQ